MPPKKPAAASKAKKPTRVSKSATARKRTGNSAKKAAEKLVVLEEERHEIRKHAHKVELQPHPQDELLVIAATQNPPLRGKRSADAAFDDRGGRSKRPVTGQNGSSRRSRMEKDEALCLFPWEKNEKLKQPPSRFATRFDTVLGSGNPVTALGDLGKLPVEIRDEIFRYNLVSENNIRVLRGWSLVYPRAKPNLDIALLSTCHILRQQGLRILFGENTFLYDIRDPADHLPATDPVLKRVFANSIIPIDLYGHLIRHVKINVPANRLGYDNMENFAKAIRKFLPGNGLLEPANIHTMTLQLPALRRRDLGWPYDPDKVPICDFVGTASKVREALCGLNIQYVRVLATDREGDTYEYMIDLRYYYKQKQEEMALADSTARPVADAEGQRAYFARQVKNAKTRLYNLPVRLWELAVLGLPKANMVRDYWKMLQKPEEGRPYRGEERELPSNWRDSATPALSPGPRLVAERRSRNQRPDYGGLTEAWLEGVIDEGAENPDVDEL
ncbi:hypothetical protein AAE478_004303 [Parahypoxylon ruwenzoriense]